MTQKARLYFFGIDDELKDDERSIYTTKLNSSLFPAPQADSTQTINGVTFITRAAGFTERKNTKRYKFTLNNHLKSLKLTPKAKLVIESITIPNVLSQSFLQSKTANNVVLKLMNISNHNIWDSSGKGKGSSVIFSAPILLNTQGFGVSLAATAEPDLINTTQKPRLNSDNNGYLFINSSPSSLYGFTITDDFMKIGDFQFELVYDIGNCWKNNATANQYENIPQTLNHTTDKDDLEGFMISLIVMDEEDEDKIYNDKKLLNKINRLLLDNTDK